MIFINLILFSILFYGLVCLTCYFFSNNIKVSVNTIFQNDISIINKKIFTFFLILNITIAFIGIVTSVIFLNNFNINFVYIALIIFSVSGIILSLNKRYFILKDLKLVFLSFVKNKNIIFYLIVLNFILALNKSFLAWGDQDEITQYGYFTRLYAEGWILEDNIWGAFTRFGELMFSSFYFVTKNLVFIKIFKSILFIGNVFCFYCLIKKITDSKKIANISSLLLITIPELSYVGFFSMKTDFLLFSYELTSIILICLIIHNLIKNTYKPLYFFDTFFLSLFFSSTAFAIRLSGVYLLSVNFFLITYLIFCIYKKDLSIKFLLKLVQLLL